jgi:hypothetical protein
MKKIISLCAILLAVLTVFASCNTQEEPCTAHTDEDKNGICDVCEADVSEGIIVIDPPPCRQRKDENGDGYCDVCGGSLADMSLDDH